MLKSNFMNPVDISGQFDTSLEYFTAFIGVGTPMQLGKK